MRRYNCSVNNAFMTLTFFFGLREHYLHVDHQSDLSQLQNVL